MAGHGHTSIETRSVDGFKPTDYVVFALLLSVNAAVGLFYVIKDKRKKQENTQEYLLAGRNQSVIPVSLSLAVTFLSANTMLGTPVDVYYHNTMFMYMALGMVIALVLASWIFIPFFYRLGYVSVLQYLEERFNGTVRTMGMISIVFQTLLYLAFVLYAPSLALSAVTGLSYSGCVVGMGAVVTLYTALGGMKTVLWTDTFQSVVMLVGLMTVLIRGISVVGGWSKVWDTAQDRGRIVLDDFSFNPSTRHSFFSVVIGGGLLWLGNFGVSQAQVQRYLSTPSISKARISVLLSGPVIVILLLLSCLIGIVMFAFYADCDPVQFGVITKKDQLLPLFMLDILGDADGFPGLFVSSVFAGSLSTLSSGQNALAAIMYEEVRRVIHLEWTEKRCLLFTRIIAVICGVIVIGLAFLVSQLGTLIEAAYTVHGTLNGPIFGLFILGMFFPWANSIGAIAGFLGSMAFMGWISIGAFVHKIKSATPSTTTTLGCNWPNGTEPIATNKSQAAPGPISYDGVDNVYTLSYLNYTMVGMVVLIVIGLAVSFLTGHTKPSDLDSKYIVPMYYVMKPPANPAASKRQTTPPVKPCISKSKGGKRNERDGFHNSYMGMAPTTSHVTDEENNISISTKT